MKKAVIEAKGKSGIVEVDDPIARQDWVVVKIHTAPMCTEYKGFLTGHAATDLGHEAAGEVVDVAQPGKVSIGDRVVVMPGTSCGTCTHCLTGEYIHCEQMIDVGEFTQGGEGRATMAQYLIKADWLLPPIPDAVSYDHASLACCGLGPSFGALTRMRVDAFDTILITGLGPVGLGGVINAVYRGARVIAVDAQPWRAQRALDLGAEVVLAPDDSTLAAIRDLTGGIGVDKALDCSGSVAAHRLCIDATRRRGQVAFVGECSDDTAIRISPDMIRKGLTLVGSWHYNLRDAAAILRIIEERPAVMDRLISHVFPMDDIQTAFELQETGDCAKVLLHPWA
ncbi:MAG: zinc-binding dehydrogenase [Gemmatimonadetes bacterium]|jgi:L-iditol 2-dehydrogenase|nr:zinc-binding dehydrogenase [Gemmatimonadota bacterium]MBT7863667.1 zinc-binding dehydrogenase [Gemmatimonadota bacterium]